MITSFVSAILDKLPEKLFCENILHDNNESITVRKNGASFPFPYRCCKIKSRFSLPGDCPTASSADTSRCTKCKYAMSKYVIFEISKDSFESFNSLIFSDYDTFFDFQKQHISKLFYSEDVYVRYNTYIVFVAESTELLPNSLLRNRIESNLDYARKCFVLYENLSEYFLPITQVEAQVDKASVPKRDRSNDIKFVNKTANVLKPELLLGYTIDVSEENVCRDRLLRHFDPDLTVPTDNAYTESLKYDELMTKNKVIGLNTADDFMKEYFANKESRQANTEAEKLQLKSVKFVNYRTNILPVQAFDFKDMTLIYALNGTGKTSILDGVMAAFVGFRPGETIAVGTEKADGITLKATVCLSNGDTIDSSDIVNTTGLSKTKFRSRKQEVVTRKKKFFPNLSGELSDLFRTLNYLEIDAVARFAYGDDVLRTLFTDEILDRFYFRYNELRKLLSGVVSFCDNHIAPSISIESSSNKWDLRQQKLIALREKCSYLQKKLPNPVCEASATLSWTEELRDSIEIINRIYRKLHSYDEKVIIDDKIGICIEEQGRQADELRDVWSISTAQRACLAYAVIFSQYIKNRTTLDFILLDEPMANLDKLHLLNMFDFLRELVVDGRQVILATADELVASVAEIKFKCLTPEHYGSIKLDDIPKDTAIGIAVSK